jgi:hypothetical protein
MLVPVVPLLLNVTGFWTSDFSCSMDSDCVTTRCVLKNHRNVDGPSMDFISPDFMLNLLR